MANSYARAGVELWRYPLSGPTGGSGMTALDVIVVEIEDSQGRTGLGFSYVLGGGGETVRATAEDLLSRFVAGADCIPPQALWRTLAGSLNRLGRGTGYLAIAAIDVAAWDLHAKALEMPLYTALGGTARAVPVYGSGGFRPNQDPDDALARALFYVERGCKAIKLRLAGDHADVARMHTVADGLPAGIDVMVDANERCDLLRAQWLANQCAEIDALFLEEPLRADALSGYAALAASSPVPIATGEHLQGVVELVPYFESRACSLVQPDLAMMGGITECLRAAQIADYHDIGVSPHFLPALFIHLACAVPDIAWLEDFPLLEPLFDDPVTMDDHAMIAPRETPGHGIAWAPGAREEFLIKDRGRR